MPDTMKSQDEIIDKILKGTQSAIDKLIKERKKEDSYLVISENGKVVRKPARDIRNNTG